MWYWNKQYQKYGCDPHWYYVENANRGRFLIHTFDGERMYFNFMQEWVLYVLEEYEILEDLGQMPDDDERLENYVETE